MLNAQTSNEQPINNKRPHDPRLVISQKSESRKAKGEIIYSKFVRTLLVVRITNKSFGNQPYSIKL